MWHWAAAKCNMKVRREQHSGRRRHWTGLSVAGVAVLGLVAACGSGGGSSNAGSSSASASASSSSTGGGQAQLTPVTFAVPILNLSAAPEEIAKDNGYFKKHGLKVKFVNARGGTNVVAAVVSGSAQFGGTDPAVVFLSRHQNAPIEAVGLTSTGIPFTLVVNKKLATQKNFTLTTSVQTMVNDIKGMTIGNLAPGDTGQLILDGLIEHQGHSASWVTPNSVRGAADQLAALNHDEIQATFTDAPIPQTAVSAGYGKIIFDLTSVPAFKSVAYGVTIAKPSWANSHAKEVQEFNAAMAEAQNFILNNGPQAAKELTTLLPKTPQKVILAGLKTEGYQTTSKFPSGSFQQAGKIANTYHLEKFTISPSLVQKSFTNKFSG